MLVEFSVCNYRSIHRPAVLSLLATSLRDDPEMDRRNTFLEGKLTLLRSAAIYGANASGKSNLVRAMMFMRSFVLDSATRVQAGERIEVERFRLSASAQEQPAYFQIIFVLDGKRYRYGFEVDEERVHGEWLYQTVQRETPLFVRVGQEFEVSTAFRRQAAPSLQERTRENALFLSVLAQFNSQTATMLLDWFRRDFRGVHGLNDQLFAEYTVNRFENDPDFRQRAQELLRLADVGILDVSVKNLAIFSQDIPPEVRSTIRSGFRDTLRGLASATTIAEKPAAYMMLETTHPVFDQGQQTGEVAFDIAEESEGTQKFFALLGPLLDTLEHGRVLVIDELDARLHPLLTREIVRLFNAPESNPHNAQLIFVAHDPGLLAANLLRRDQVWFAQKNRYGATELYSLAEMKERNDASYFKNYLSGRYGGVPLIGGMNSYIEQELANDAQAEAKRA